MRPDHALTFQTVEKTLNRYCHLVDDGDFDGLVELFAADGSFTFGGRTTTGRVALRKFYEVFQPPHLRGKHVVANVVVELEDDQRARAVADYVFFAFSAGTLVPLIAGRYDDTLVLHDGAWLFESRVVTTLAAPDS